MSDSKLKRIVWMTDRAHLAGGIERYVKDTAAALRRRGVRSTLLYDVAQSPNPSRAMLEPFEAAFPMVDVEAQLRALTPDVVYVHRVDGVDKSRAIERCGLPVVRFFHDHRLFCLREHKYTALGNEPCHKQLGLGCYVCPGFLTRGGAVSGGLELVTLGKRRREVASSQAAARYVVGSAYMAEQLRVHGFDSRRTHVIPLYTSDPGEPIPIEPSAAEDAPEILFAGLLTTGKGLDVLLDAMSTMKIRVKLSVVGRGRQEHEYRAQSTRLGLEDRVSFLGWLDADELLSAYRRADCVVFPSRAPETFGLVGLEAMSHARPVVASDVGGVREWLIPGLNGMLFKPNDPGGLASALDVVCGDRWLARRLGLAGRARYLRQFREDHHVRSLLSVLENAARVDG